MRLKFEILNPNPSTHSTALRAGFAQDKNRNSSFVVILQKTGKFKFTNVQNSKVNKSKIRIS